MTTRLSLLGLLLALVAAPSWADVTIADAWVRGTVPGQKATGAFMQITSPTDAALVAAASPVAKTVEIHEMKMDGGMMRMRAVPQIPLPAGKPVPLAPGGYHVMLMDLAQPLKEGDSVTVTLTFADKDGRKTTQEVKAPVRALTAPAGMPKH
jgi:periplasmic copper chaperone A